MSKPITQAISFRLEGEKLQRLEELAAATDRPRSWHIEQALDAYLEVQAWQLQRIESGIASLEQGRSVPHDRVKDWLESWGSDDEGKPPT